ncbi:1,2-dihydroxy-3-keto-5-methylthiopentene dioxygenase [Haliangium sp.]|uniref:1,2-dihydroxy-3-keto-5-methylthiopentene dioxygenase n=1 Tax=Haliangium sp. TaxID=2663208 RepID=UPI003D0D2965
MNARWMDETGAGATGDEISADTLRAEGVVYALLETAEQRYQGALDELKASHGYLKQDEVVLEPDNPNLDAICAKFADEHRHDEDEVRFVLAGVGIFDIRARDERWMRVEVEAGDLIVVPAGRYHRFFLTDAKHIRALRLFKDPAGWVPHYRAADEAAAEA